MHITTSENLISALRHYLREDIRDVLETLSPGGYPNVGIDMSIAYKASSFAFGVQEQTWHLHAELTDGGVRLVACSKDRKVTAEASYHLHCAEERLRAISHIVARIHQESPANGDTWKVANPGSVVETLKMQEQVRAALDKQGCQRGSEGFHLAVDAARAAWEALVAAAHVEHWNEERVTAVLVNQPRCENPGSALRTDTTRCACYTFWLAAQLAGITSD